MTFRTFVYDVYIATTPEELWKALTETEYTEKYFFGSAINSNWEIGTDISYSRDGQVTDYGKIITYEPNQILSFTWNYVKDTNKRDEPTEVTFVIKPLGGIVKLTLKHEKLLPQDFNSDPDTFEGFNNGWPYVLSNLKSLLETGKVLAM